MTALQHDGVRGQLMRSAALRGRRLAFCYHRIAPEDGREHAIDPIEPERFARQMQALQRLGRVVPLHEFLAAPPSPTPLFTITFDDDDPCHVQYALPVLKRLGISATFFLSGRAFHGLGAYWWTRVERYVEEAGLAAACRVLGHEARSLTELVRRCREAGGAPDIETRTPIDVMDPSDIRVLADAGMTIGFHTLRHPALALLDDKNLAAAFVEGREELRTAAGRELETVAYPYGRTNVRVAAAARTAGFRAGVATAERAITPASDPFLLPRWQPAPRRLNEFVAETALRLIQPARPARYWLRT